jgi:pimeloyl-ACP methyl ester carboxylesterase
LLSSVIAGIAVLALGGAAAAARAQMWVEPADVESGIVGPSMAEGAVIWSHGRSLDSEDSTAPTPPYLAMLRQGGWDTFRFNRMRADDTFSNSSSALIEEVHRLKQQGYRQVALAGQSFGGFLSLIAADASDEVDAVIVTAPAAFGSSSEVGSRWRNNAAKLYPLLEAVRYARVMLFYFNGDEFDPGERAEPSRSILTRQHLSYVVIDQPAQLIGHWAAGSDRFAQLYGNCILGFLDAVRVNEGAQCRGKTFWAGDATPSPRHPALASAAGRLQSASP